jgi:hypothetical protein
MCFPHIFIVTILFIHFYFEFVISNFLILAIGLYHVEQLDGTYILFCGN